MILDVKGKNCPIPLLRTRHHMHHLNSGESIQILSTDYGTIRDMRAFCEKHGHILESVTKQSCDLYDTVYVCTVIKG